MAWCPNCDEIREIPTSEPCPVCSAATLDAERLRAPRPARGVALLELAPDAPTEAPEAPAAFTVPPAVGRLGRLTRITSSRRLVAGALAVALVAGGGLALAGRSAGSAIKKASPEESIEPGIATTPDAPSTDTAPVSAPPLGVAVPGSLLVVAEGGFTIVDLTTGAEREPTSAMPAQAWPIAVSRDGRAVIVRDEFGMGWIVEDLDGGEARPIASDVYDAAFTEDGAHIVLVRAETITDVVERTRVERRRIDGSETKLLYETTKTVNGIAWRRGTLLVQITDDEGINALHEVTGRNKTRLIRRDVTLLDVSADGERALVRPDGPGLQVLDISSRAAASIGPKNLLVAEGTFAPDGKAATIIGTTNFETVKICEENGCGVEHVAGDAQLFRLDLESRKLKKIYGSASLRGATWGPAGWLFFLNDESIGAVRADGTDDRTFSVSTDGGASRLHYRQ